MKFRALIFPVLMAFLPAARATLGAVQPDLNKPQAPFKIIGNIYYVGASDVTS